ncbi:putative methyltransferase, YaeB/AF_0241 family [Klebsiella michiganensis]|uniref:Putative methyltransferase, YaeB/AF_0241 family n=1 Tax=Klebsiella michiganensis TaxID=1134687 RepID=A0A7H4LZJ2_9ENTR|nr:putative methyltransferase, YaeB/AF_0241 family [Klebsiella michiganensis]
MSDFQFAQIGVIRSPYKEKFAVPRQPGLVKNGGGELYLLPPYNQADAVRGLENFSHLWILFVFHPDHGRRLAPDRAPSPSRR